MIAASRSALAPLSAAIMVGAMATVFLGWLPISIASVVGATLMVVSGCLDEDRDLRSALQSFAAEIRDGLAHAQFPIEVLADYDRAMNRYAFLLIE